MGSTAPSADAACAPGCPILTRSVGSVIFYALGLSFLLVGLHGMFHVPDDLFVDEPQVGGEVGPPFAHLSRYISNERACVWSC